MSARDQISSIVALWQRRAGNLDNLVDSLLALLYRNGVTLAKGRNPIAEQVFKLTAERHALLTRVDAIDDELRDYGQTVERIGKSLVHPPQRKPPPPPAPPPKRRIG